MQVRRVAVVLFCVVAFCFVLEPAHSQGSPQRAPSIANELPKELSSLAFRQLINDFSEPGGNFPSDNFVSNETTFQDVIPELTQHSSPDGVYLGVGPDQNFTYIAALQSKMAFIIDIRRQNMIQHLMYKALFELSPDRAGFLSQLFSRPRPLGIGANSTAEELFGAFSNVEPDGEMFRTTLGAIKRHLIEHHGFVLTAEDEASLAYIFKAFFTEGPNLTYDGMEKRFGPKRSPTYQDLLTQTDEGGQNRSYMASENNFRFIQNLQKKNLIIPLVGDFAGEKAIRSVAQYVRDRAGRVSAFYVSNVEQYLFQKPDAWSEFYLSLGTLPIDSSAMLIRSVFSRRVYGPWPRPSNRATSVSLLAPIEESTAAFNAGEILRYDDVIRMSR